MNRSRLTPLHIDGERFREMGHELVDAVAALFEGIPQGPVARGESPSEVRATLQLDGGIPEQGSDPGELLRSVTAQLCEHSLYNGHPKFFGYITSSPAPIGALADLLAAAVNPNLGGWTLSPAASEIEAQTVRWIAEMLDYPTDCGGLLVSGGNMANFVCFLAARRAKAGWPVQAEGLRAGPALRVYGSSATHTWIQKACDLFGLGTDAFRSIATDSYERMDVEALRRQIAADRREGDRPCLVIGSGGTVSVGAVDDLPALAKLCREEEIWFHVDGAYGAFAAVSSEAPDELHGMSLADSVAVDPHKWLYAPLEAGCALVRDREALRDAFSYHPPYYHFGIEEAVNFVDYGMQNSRGFRALKVWLALRQAGRAGYEQMITEDIQLSRRMHEHAEAHPELETHSQMLSISTFRYVPERLRDSLGDEETEGYLNELNQRIQSELERNGQAFVSNAVIGDRYLLRACIVNINTGPEDVRELPEIVVALGRQLDGELSK